MIYKDNKMEEDVETKSLESYEETSSVSKDDIKDEKIDNETSPSESYTSSQHHNLSRILSINPLADSKDTSSILTTQCERKTEELEDGAASICVCGEPSTKQISEDDPQQLQIECDICRVWYHAHCVGIGSVGILAIDKYHCPRCAPMCGPSIFKLRTNTHRYDYTDPNAKNLAKQIGTLDFIDELRNRIMPEVGLNSESYDNVSNGTNLENVAGNFDVVTCLPDGRQLTLPFLNSSGFCCPIMIDVCDPEGLGLILPDAEFCSDDVPSVVDGGRERLIDVIDVYSQDTRRMPLGEFCDAFRVSSSDRDSSQCLNCLSLEVSDSLLGIHHLSPPRVARQLCWVNNVWPKSKEEDVSTSPPKVQKYCIMSMKNAFTDFHIDFGGTSVWYHIFKGEKIFYFIRPTPTNLSLYERWQRLSTQSEIFLGDMVDKCYRCVVQEGQTLFIPTGWIHAVLTTEDSLVFGGNFLHSLNIQLQLKVFEIEERMRIPRKFRYPAYEAVNWLAAQKLKNDLSDLNGDSTLCPAHLLGGIRSLLQTLRSWLVQLPTKSDSNSSNVENNNERDPCPSAINDPHKLVRELNKEVRLAEKIQLKCNPPKPARESTRMKRKKEDDDFIDISSRNALTFFNQPPSKKKKANAASKTGKTKQKTTNEDVLSTDEQYVVSKKFPFNKVKSNGNQKTKKQSKRESDEIDIEETLVARKTQNLTKGKKVKHQNSIKNDKSNDISKMPKRNKTSNKNKENDGKVDLKEITKKNISKKKLQKIAVQDYESQEEDIDIITMHNDSDKSQKKTKTPITKKKVVNSNSDDKNRKQPKSLNKITVSKNGSSKKKKNPPEDLEENCSQKEVSIKKVAKGNKQNGKKLKKIKSNVNYVHDEETSNNVTSQRKKNAQNKKGRPLKGGLKSPKKSGNQHENGYLETNDSEINSYLEPNESLVQLKAGAKKKAPKINKKKELERKKTPIKLKLPRVPPAIVDNINIHPQNHFSNTPKLHSGIQDSSPPLMLQDGLPQSLLPQAPLPLSAISSPSPSNYDLTDRDSVRQLLSSRGNPIQSLHRQSVVKKAPMKELNSALGDALAGFDDFQDHQNDVGMSGSVRQEETTIAAAGPIKLKLKMFGKTSPGDSISNNQLETNYDSLANSTLGSKIVSSIALTKPLTSEQQKKRAAMLFGSAGATAANERMTKVHQDEEYVYPSLDLSDDEMEIAPTSLQGSNAGRDKGSDGDTAWCPKMRVRNLAVNQRVDPRPSRDNAKKVAAVEMGLKMAAEKRRKSSALAVSPNSLILHSSSSPTKAGLKSKANNSLMKKRKTQSLLPISSQEPNLSTEPTSLFSNLGEPEKPNSSSFDIVSTPTSNNALSGSASSSTVQTKNSSGLLKPKKGLLTAKQRLGKILKLKF